MDNSIATLVMFVMIVTIKQGEATMYLLGSPSYKRSRDWAREQRRRNADQAQRNVTGWLIIFGIMFAVATAILFLG